MVKTIHAAVFALVVFSFASANKCSNLLCLDQSCCHSTRNGEECCPTGTKCDSELGCIQTKNDTLHPLRKLKECPPPETTCYSTIIYDVCCPLPEGVCCADLVHCCPEDTICDVPNQRCLSKDCPIGTTTCLETPLGDICCPYFEGVCCDDKVHCCPHGYECDLDHQQCNKTNSDVALHKRSIPSNEFGSHKCGENTWCPQEDECCKDNEGRWSCCRSFTKMLGIEKRSIKFEDIH